MIERIHLVDATYELFRSWFGAPPRKAPDGREIGAARGVVASMIVMLRDEGATHVGCATDHVVRSFRNDLFDGYKTEAGVPAELLGQFSLLEEWLAALGLTVWPMVAFEADDAMATAALRFAPDAEQILLATVDKDLTQCVIGQRVIMLDRRKKLTLDEAAVVSKFGVPPKLIPELLALVGDSADGFPGIPGFGMKTAATLLNHFGSIEQIPHNPSLFPKTVRGAPRLAATLDERRDEARLYLRLATLRTDVPIGETAEDLRWRGATPAFAELCERLGQPDLPSRLPPAAIAPPRP